MTKQDNGITRRQFLAYSGATAGTVAATMTLGGHAFAQDFPTHAMQVVIPTGEGGGLDRIARTFAPVWTDHLGANFEFDYYPGASGQVGYEVYLGRRDANAYNLLFGNMSPELTMYATQDPSYEYPEDYAYFAGLDSDDAVIWVANNSPYKTIEDLVEAAQTTTLNLSTSRLPHPASLGVLALAEATGAKLRLIPYGGGSAARGAALTGEVDACATFMGSSLALQDQIRFLTVFTDRNRVPKLTNNAPVVNEVFDTSIPSLKGTRAWAIHRDAIEQYPDRFQTLQDTVRAAFNDPAYKAQLAQANIPWELAEFNDMSGCRAIAKDILALAARYKDILTA